MGLETPFLGPVRPSQLNAWTQGLQAFNVCLNPYNALGNGQLASDAARAQGAIDDAIANGGGVVVFPYGRDFRLEKSLQISGLVSDLWIISFGATFHLPSQTQFAFQFRNGLSMKRVRIFGGRIIGTANPADLQRGIGTLTASDAGGDDIMVDYTSSEDVTVGVAFDCSNLDGWTNLRFYQNRCVNIVGVVSGSGYGLACSAARGVTFLDNYVERAQRHSIYISASEEVRSLGNRLFRHRLGIGAPGDRLAAHVIARSSNVVAMGNQVIEAASCACTIEPRELASGANRGIRYTNNIHRDNTAEEILVGSTSPATDFELSDVNVDDNTITRSAPANDGTIPCRVYSGKRVSVSRNRVYMDSAYTVQMTFAYLPATGGVAFTDDVTIDDNEGIITSGIGGTVGLLEVSAALCASTQLIRARRNALRATGAGSNRTVLYDGPISNPNLVVRSSAQDQRYFTDRGDASVTLTADGDAPQQLFATALTANRTVTLSTLGANPGDEFLVTRAGLGAFTLDVGGLKTLPAGTAAAARVRFDGAAWKLIQYGTL